MAWLFLIKRLSDKFESFAIYLKKESYKPLFISTEKEDVRISAYGSIENIPAAKDHIKIGSGVLIEGILSTFSGKGHITIGSMSYIGPNSRIWSYEHITIGMHTLISHNCNIFDSNCHPIDWELRRQDYENILRYGRGNILDEVITDPIIIGNDVWIGANSIILKGVNLGDRTIVAAGSVVTKSFPSDVMIAGNPAHIIKRLVREKDAEKF